MWTPGDYFASCQFAKLEIEFIDSLSFFLSLVAKAPRDFLHTDEKCSSDGKSALFPPKSCVCTSSRFQLRAMKCARDISFPSRDWKQSLDGKEMWKRNIQKSLVQTLERRENDRKKVAFWLFGEIHLGFTDVLMRGKPYLLIAHWVTWLVSPLFHSEPFFIAGLTHWALSYIRTGTIHFGNLRRGTVAEH